ncbi:MAG: class I SAM-dependent methyltransferase [Ilumatobacteraceae bacterium]
MSEATQHGNAYDKYASTNPIEQRMMRGFMGALDAMLDGLAPRRILEVGVGEGHVLRRVLQRFPAATVAGVDLPDDALSDDWRADGLPCMFGDATALPFPDATFDLVLAIEVLEHVPVADAALAELARVCSGTLVASVPFEPIWRAGNLARRRYVRDLGNTPGHVNHWTRRSFRRFVATRFTVDDVRTPLPWTMVRGRPGKVAAWT